MDIDDIDQWSRELLQSEARKRGYINASMYSRPELVKLILRHDISNTKNAKAAAWMLLDKAKSAMRLGLDAAAHAATRRRRTTEPMSRPIPTRGTRSRIQPPRPAPGDTVASAASELPTARADAVSTQSMFPAAVSAAATPASAQPSAASGAVGVSAPATSTPVEHTPELRPPALRGSSPGATPPPLELREALTNAQLTAAAGPVIAQRQTTPARVDPSPELRPPANEDQPAGGVSLPFAARYATNETLHESYSSSEQDAAPRASIPPTTTQPELPIVTFEHADLPLSAATLDTTGELPGLEHLSYGPPSEHGLVVRWRVSLDGVERARSVLGGPGELAVRVVAVRVDAHAVVHTEIHDHGPVERIGDWTAPLLANAARYVSAIGLRTPERFVSIVHATS